MISAHSVKKIMVLIRKSIVSCEFQDKLMCETWKTAICQQHLRSKFSHAGKEICISYGASINFVDRILRFFDPSPLSLTILQKAYVVSLTFERNPPPPCLSKQFMDAPLVLCMQNVYYNDKYITNKSRLIDEFLSNGK